MLKKQLLILVTGLVLTANCAAGGLFHPYQRANVGSILKSGAVATGALAGAAYSARQLDEIVAAYEVDHNSLNAWKMGFWLSTYLAGAAVGIFATADAAAQTTEFLMCD